MALQLYITYEEYVGLGGTVSEDAFPNIARKAQRFLDYVTFDRIKYLTTIPDEVKEVMTDYINQYGDIESHKNDAGIFEKYSNGVETITYRRTTDTQFNKDMLSVATKWLPNYLVNRSVNFDVEKYLQSESNNP